MGSCHMSNIIKKSKKKNSGLMIIMMIIILIIVIATTKLTIIKIVKTINNMIKITRYTDNKLKGGNLPWWTTEIADRKIHISFILIYPLVTRRGFHRPSTSIFPIRNVSSCQLIYIYIYIYISIYIYIYIYIYIHIDTNKYQQCNKRAQYNCRAIIVYNYCTIIIII